MSEYSQPWDGTDIGHAASRAPYSEQEWDEMWETWFGSLGNHGVIPGIDNELEVTVTGLNTIQVDPGCVLVKGKWYRNTAPLSINVPNASAGNWREDGIILRCNWVAKTITVVRKENTTGENTAWDNSMLTQTEGTTWEIPLAAARVTDGGVVTVTDARHFLKNVQTDKLFPAQAFSAVDCAPTFYPPEWVDGAVSYWAFDPDRSEMITLYWLMPTHVRGDICEITLYWLGTATGAGAVDWIAHLYLHECGGDLTSPTSYRTWCKIPGSITENEVRCTELDELGGSVSLAVFLDSAPGNLVEITLHRVGANPADTYASDAGVVGLRIRVA